MSSELPDLNPQLVIAVVSGNDHSTYKPRILLLHRSTRERSFSRLQVEESARLLERDAGQL